MSCPNKVCAQGTVPCVKARNTKNTQNRPLCYVHNNKVNTYKTMILETILNGNESDLYFELSSIILITTTLFGESENKELLNSIIFEKVEGLV